MDSEPHGSEWSNDRGATIGSEKLPASSGPSSYGATPDDERRAEDDYRSLLLRSSVGDRPDREIYDRIGEFRLKGPLCSGAADLEARRWRRNLAEALTRRRPGVAREGLNPRHRPVAGTLKREPLLHMRPPYDTVGAGGA